MLDDEEQLVVLRRVALRLLGGQQEVEPEVVAVRHLLGEVLLDARARARACLRPVGAQRLSCVVPWPTVSGLSRKRDVGRCGLAPGLALPGRLDPASATPRGPATRPTASRRGRAPHWRGIRTPEGPATLTVQARPGSGEVRARRGVPGAEWALDSRARPARRRRRPERLRARPPVVAEAGAATRTGGSAAAAWSCRR